MSETQTQAAADNEAGWKKLQSENGQDYRVNASDYDISEPPAAQDEPAASGPPFNVQVNWPVGSEGAPSQEVQDRTAITWYKLEKLGFWNFYDYRLTIATQDTYNYTFFDQEPDYYGLNVFDTRGTHSVEFKSGNPTIRSITGT
ncbi:hypothetical protein FSARC_6371 [Fusarium sarcochroum]|uniref:Uncharacterized protein n=1 Tax=Fusarium sarcochroum TaxID=1208366 RepID=A0A8H4X9E2_9HYPO|nr:hypothetical protein FSARC_6371 [Fusarium sarcochroum]